MNDRFEMRRGVCRSRMGSAGEQRTCCAGRVVTRSLHARIVRAVQTVAVMLQRVQLRALLHHHKQECEENGDEGVLATCHGNDGSGIRLTRGL